MSLWGSNDSANNAPKNKHQVAGALNKARGNTLYQNTTANAFIAGQTIGIFAVDTSEAHAKGGKVTSPGWVKVTTGQGGRSGRVQYETLVAMHSVHGDTGTDDATFPNANLVITSQTGNLTANSGTNAVFTVAISEYPVGTVAYQWQANTCTGFANIAANATFTGVTTNTFKLVSANVSQNNYSFRVVVTDSTANVSVTSANSKLTVS